MKPHKHAEVIKAWADGAEIQYYSTSQKDWRDTSQPSWSSNYDYRIKPTVFTCQVNIETINSLLVKRVIDEINNAIQDAQDSGSLPKDLNVSVSKPEQSP